MPAVPRRATIRDVARLAGVSTTTVSDALNGRGRPAAETRERVREVADALGYHARSSARAFREGRTGQVGVFCPALADIPSGVAGSGYYIELAMGAAEVALAEDLALVLLPATLEPESLAAVAVDGLIVSDPLRDDPALRALSATGMTIVTCERDPTVGAHHAGCVRNDHGTAMRDLLDHLVSAGARRIALVVAGEEMAWSSELRATYWSWCEQREAPVLLAQVPTSPRPEQTERAGMRLLEDRQPDAIVCAQDGGAAALVRTLTNRGVRVPDDVLVASCVDGAAAAAANPSITAIDNQPTLVGRRAAGLLTALLRGREDFGTEVIVPTRLRVRESTEATA